MRALGGGIAGGLLAGAAVGTAEALGGWLHAHGIGELPALAWALVAYGAVGGSLGLGAARAAGGPCRSTERRAHRGRHAARRPPLLLRLHRDSHPTYRPAGGGRPAL